MQNIFHVDREKLALKRGLIVVAVVAAAALLEMVFGDAALFGIGALIAAYFVSRVGFHKRGRQRWSYMGIAIAAGVTLSLLSLVVGDDTLRAIILWPVTIYLAGLAVAYGKSVFYAGYFLVFWVLFAMLAASRSPGEPIYYAASFLVGGIIALIVMAVRLRFGWIDDSAMEPTSTPRLRDVAKSDIGVFAAMWALTMAVAVGLGYTFWSVEPFWVASTLLVVMQPDVAKGRRTGIQRAIGSAVGGLLALTIITAFPDFVTSGFFVLYFLVATALCVMFYWANYMIYAFFMTQAVVIYYGHEVGNFTLAGGQRMIGVLLGVVIGIVGLALQSAIIKSRKQRNKTA
ncbi:FUSC family protein [Demequina aurantiaca]|uniref:FUSC family protein n=1 Tax=Demequina aurantiaca TaxID=676200 RepID=UPI003D349C1A